MRKFLYNAMNSSGTITKDMVEANTLEEAKEIINQQKLVVLKIKEKKNINSLFRANADLSLKQTSQFFTNFSIMMDTGITISNVIENLIDTENDKKILMFLNSISQNLRRGESLANSMRLAKPSIELELVKMIEAAEVSGKLSSVLKEMNLLLSTKTMLRQKITNALIYPSFLLLVTIIVLNIILTQVVPQFAQTFQNSDASLPTITLFLFNISDFINNYGFETLIGFTLTVLALVYLKSKKIIKSKLSEFSLKIPYLSKLIVNGNYTLFCRQMSINLLSGLQIDHAIELSISSLSNLSIKNRLNHIPEEIRKGSSLSKELKLVKIFPAYSVTMISAGEESNQLIRVFDKLSIQLNTEVENSIERISKLIEPSVIIILGVVIAIIAFGILSPILTLNEIV